MIVSGISTVCSLVDLDDVQVNDSKPILVKLTEGKVVNRLYMAMP